MIKTALAALCLGAALLFSPVPGPAAQAGGLSAARPDPQDVKAVMADCVRALGLQTELPGEGQKDLLLTTLLDVTSHVPPFRLPSFDTVSFIATVILWGSVLGAAVVILLNLKTNLWSFSRARQLRREEPEGAAPAAVAARMEQSRVEADDLAVRGNYAEAMHILLLRSVGEVRRRLDVPIAASLTSREILRSVGLSPGARASFADIIGRVEVSYFGAHQPDEEDYRACRRSFEALTGALGQENAA